MNCIQHYQGVWLKSSVCIYTHTHIELRFELFITAQPTTYCGLVKPGIFWSLRSKFQITVKNMENGLKLWHFQGTKEQKTTSAATSVRVVRYKLMESLNKDDPRPMVPLAHGDPSSFPCFRTTTVAEDAIVDALRSAKFNSYTPPAGIPSARRAVAEHLSKDLPYELSPEDVYLTVGCQQAIEVILSALAKPGANILLPKPGFPFYEVRAAHEHLEVRHYDLVPESGWEVNLDTVQALTDENTVAMVIINPGNPCGNLYTHKHLEKVAETARKLGIMVIADEVYAHLNFGDKPFVPMGTYGSIAPVITLGSISKRWLVPGWRLGWLVTNDPNDILQKTGFLKTIVSCCNMASDPTSFIQAALPKIIEETTEEYFSSTKNMLREAVDMCLDRIQEIPCFDCPWKPEASMFIMVKLNTKLLEDINNDMEFSLKLASEESVIVLPGIVMGMDNWLRITFAIEHSVLEDGLARIKAFCDRHIKQE